MFAGIFPRLKKTVCFFDTFNFSNGQNRLKQKNFVLELRIKVNFAALIMRVLFCDHVKRNHLAKWRPNIFGHSVQSPLSRVDCRGGYPTPIRPYISKE